MKIADYLKAIVHHAYPYQIVKLCPVCHYDDMENDGTNDYVLTAIVGTKQVAYRIPVELAMSVDNSIASAIIRAIEGGVPVSIYTATKLEADETNL